MGRKRIHSREQEEQILADYARLSSREKVAREWGCSGKTVARIVQSLGGVMMPPKPPYSLSEAEADRVVALYLVGNSTKEVAKIVGKKINLVWETLSRRRKVSMRDFPFKRKYKIDESFFNPIDTPAKAWVLGLLTADGCVCQNYIIFSQAEKDIDVLERVSEAMDYHSPIRVRATPSDHPWGESQMCRLQIYSKKMSEDLSAVGVGLGKSKNATPWRGPPHLLSHYYRGLLDGDGSISKSAKGQWRIDVAGTKAICDGFADFVFNLTSFRPTVRERPSCWEVYMTRKNETLMVAKELYDEAVLFHARKKRMADLLISDDS